MTIAIRRTEPSDYEAFHLIFSSPGVIWGTLQLPFPSLDVWQKRLADPPEGMIGLVACSEKEIVGQLDLYTHPNHPRRRHAGMIGMAVRDDWQGKGVGTGLMLAAVDLADNWLNLLRLEIEVYTDNEPAIRLYQKFNFSIEGTFKKYAYREGQYIDVYVMARLKNDVLSA